MVLISGNNKSSSFLQTNDERAKAQGVTALHNPHQQGNRSAESTRTQNFLNTALTKGMTTMDEFKYGFPSESLSSTSNKWWGSKYQDDRAITNTEGAKSQLEDKGGESEKMECETGKTETQGSSLLTGVRKRAVEEGREAFKLGIFRGSGVNKLGKREKILLHQIFGSSFPRSWMHYL